MQDSYNFYGTFLLILDQAISSEIWSVRDSINSMNIIASLAHGILQSHYNIYLETFQLQN